MRPRPDQSQVLADSVLGRSAWPVEGATGRSVRYFRENLALFQASHHQRASSVS
jgi:hypothetical protein